MKTSEFILPKGVSGVVVETRQVGESFSRFKSACYEAARRIEGRARGFVSAGITPNFHQATITVKEEQMLVVCNADFGFLAIARVSDDATLRFLDDELLAKYFKLQGYTVLDNTVLLNELNQENCSNLTAEEKEQLDYWRCKTVGEVIFNWFD